MMTGFPPPPGERWAPGTWQLGPTNRWSFSHLRQVVRTARIPASTNPAPLPAGNAPLDLTVPVNLSDGNIHTLHHALERTYTDGMLVLHRGHIVLEHYPARLTPTATHALLSVSKSLIGCVVGILIDQCLLEKTSNVTTYLPELVGRGYDGATIRHLLDMRSGIKYSEHYEEPDAEINMVGQVVDWTPRTKPPPAHLPVRLPDPACQVTGARRPVRIPLLRNRCPWLDL